MGITASAEERPVIEIAPSAGWRALDLAELFRYRELLHVMVWRDIKVRYRQTFFGVLWVVAQPMLTMLIFTVLFNRVAKIEADRGLPYSVFVMAALVPWTFFSSAVSSASNSLIGSTHLIAKVYFPRMIVPAASVLGGLVDLAVTLGIVVAMGIIHRVSVGMEILLLPLLALIAAMMAFGCGLWLSSLNVEYRDIRVVVPFLLQIWMYATPVVYPARVIPERYRWVLFINPMSGVTDGFRAALLGGEVPWAALMYSLMFTLVVTVTGAFYFRRMERQFADVL